MTELTPIPISDGYDRKEEVDIQRAKKVYVDLINNIVHPGSCLCPSCLYQFDKKYRGKYDKEIFFLSWLEFEVSLSLINQKEDLVFETAYDSGTFKKFIKLSDTKNLIKGYGRIKALSNFIKKNFPEIDHNHKRLKLRLWRFKKSGIELKIEREIRRKNIKPEEQKIWKRNWDDLKFAQRVVNFINSRPNKRVSQRELLRRFSNKCKEDLERIQDSLKINWQIEIKPVKRSIVYRSTMKSNKGRYWRVGE